MRLKALSPLFLVAFLGASTALAQSDPAADHYRAGVTHFKAGQYSEAIAEFRAADSIRPSPVLSFNIAQCFEKMADLRSAKSAYQDYLRRAPAAEDRQAVEATIASIDQKLASEKSQDAVVIIPPSPPLEVRGPGERRSPNYTLGAIAGGVGVATLAAAVILNAISLQNAGSLQLNGQNGWASKANLQGFYDNASNLWTGALIAYVAGGVLTATGAGILGYQYFTRPVP